MRLTSQLNQLTKREMIISSTKFLLPTVFNELSLSLSLYRFLVRNTIEEKMTVMLDRHRSNISGRSATSAKENPVTVADLKALFEET